MDDKLLEIPIGDWYGLHDGYRLPIWPGWTPVVGPNGAGKSTLLHQVGEWRRKNKVDAWSYSNQRDGGQMGREAMALRGDLAALATAVTSSEGEELAIHLGRAMRDLGRRIAEAVRKRRPLVVLLDGLDSGASEDRIAELASLLDCVEQGRDREARCRRLRPRRREPVRHGPGRQGLPEPQDRQVPQVRILRRVRRLDHGVRRRNARRRKNGGKP